MTWPGKLCALVALLVTMPVLAGAWGLDDPPGDPGGDPLRAAEILSQRHDLSEPGKRAEVVARLRALDEARERRVREKAQNLGVPLSGKRKDGGEFVLHDFEGNDPLYEQTENVNAAISSAANLVRETAPFGVDGTGELIGLWETSLPRGTHQEFGSPSRLTFGEGSSGTSDHATHVAGTLIAAGVNSSRKGMAPGAQIVAYDSAGDSTEMTNLGASHAGEPGKIYLSNHSYGFGRGWSGNVWLGSFSDDGDPANDIEDDFGRYSSYAVGIDGLTYNLPYYLPFFSSGNQGNDGPPSNGATWYVGSTSGASYAYDAARHPAGDGGYKNGYDTCEGKKVAKNVMAIGAVSDAVSGGSRNVGSASLSAISSTGPADDGRIKPDVVANGSSLISCGSASDTDTATKSGTSMASPSAAGAAALLVNYYGSRFSGGAMRAATLKGLIIHTADDLGNPGPDYQYGWGLMNTEAAATLIKEHADAGGGRMMEEDEVSSAAGSRSWEFASDGTEPLRVTLCWTDPPGTEKNGHDNRAGALVNDLNLRITGPGGTHYPWVMPHVGDWSLATLDDDATTGVNTVDTVEQVHVAAPAAGIYTVTVDHAGGLTHGIQEFSVLFSGLLPGPFLVTPRDEFLLSGVVGGPLSPVDKTYTLINNGTASLDWSAGANVSWLELTPSSGILAPGATTMVTVAPNAAATVLAPGVHGALVTFTNNGSGVATLSSAQLTLADPLAVVPGEAFSTSGPPGGPFSETSKFYTLTNNGPASLEWSAAEDAIWLDLSPASGTLAPGASVMVLASLNAAADGLAEGGHNAVLTFADLATGEATQVAAQLTVLPVAQLPFTEDFENPLAAYWRISGTGPYRTEQSSANGPHAGAQHLQMDSGTDGSDARNEFTLAVDLSGTQGVQVSFWAREFSDEPNAPPPSPFTGGADFDGVAVSPDGVTWFPVFEFPPLFSTYTRFTINLDAELAAHGVAYNNQFRIRFNHFDNNAIATDGIAIDDIRVTSTPPPTFTSLPVWEDFEASLADHWRITGTGSYRAEVGSANEPREGARHFLMDSSLSATSARNELTLAVDLAAVQGVRLSFWAREFGDELHLPPASPFVGGADYDGVSVSPDGLQWYSIFTFPESFTAYTQFTIDLDAAVAAHGVSYTDEFRIRFTQFDNFPLTADGIAIDAIELVVLSDPEIAVELPGGLELADGGALIDFGSIPLGSGGTPLALTVSNTGSGVLSGLAVTMDGNDAADFSIGGPGMTTLAPGESTNVTVTFAPGGAGVRSAALHVLSNDADESPFDIPVGGIGLHTLENWRLAHFGTTENTGDAADLADPNGDGIINLLAFAAGLDPFVSGVFPLAIELAGGDIVVSYPRSRAALAAGLGFTIEWSDTLSGGWNSAGVAEAATSDDGLLQTVEAILPQGPAGKRFVRLRVTGN